MAELVGREASATFGASSWSGVIGVTLYGFVTRYVLRKEAVNVTRWGDVHSRYVGGQNDAVVSLAFTVDSTHTPIIPDGTAATLVVFTKTSATAKRITFTTGAIVTGTSFSADARSGAEIMEVTFQITAVTIGEQPGVAS